jgi:hypothetical protein
MPFPGLEIGLSPDPHSVPTETCPPELTSAATCSQFFPEFQAKDVTRHSGRWKASPSFIPSSDGLVILAPALGVLFDGGPVQADVWSSES